MREVHRYSHWPSPRLAPRGAETSLSSIAIKLDADIRAKEQEIDFLRLKLMPPAEVLSLPTEIGLSRPEIIVYRPFFERRSELERLRSFRESLRSKVPSP